MNRALSEQVEFSRGFGPQVSGTSTVLSSIVDMNGFGGVIAIVDVGGISATGTVVLTFQKGDESDLSDAVDTNATLTASDTDDNSVLVLDATVAQERYWRLKVERNNATSLLNSCLIGRYESRGRAVSLGSIVSGEPIGNPT